MMLIAAKVEKTLGLESTVSPPPEEHFRNTDPQASSSYFYFIKMERLQLHFNKNLKRFLC